MDILLSKEGLDLDDFYTISSYEKFAEMTDEEFQLIRQIRIDDFNLGASCILNLADRPRKILDRTSFILNVLDTTELLCLQYFLRKYKRVYQKECELKKIHKYKSVHERKPKHGRKV